MRKKKRVFGTSERPRLSVYRSLKHLHVQLIDDTEGQTLASASTLKMGKYGGNIAAAKALGKLLAEHAAKLGIKKVVFDRGYFRYHGRVKALADVVREGGISF